MGSTGFGQMSITIEEISSGSSSTLFAYGTDNFGRNVQVPIGVQRAKGVPPKVGETWLIDKEFGVWTFVAILNNPGAVASVVAGENITINNSDPSNPIISASGGGGTPFMVYDTNGNLPSAGTINLTPENPENCTGGPALVQGSIAGEGWYGSGTFVLDSANNVTGGSWWAVFDPQLATLSEDGLEKDDPYTYAPIYHIGAGGEHAYVAGAIDDSEHNQFWTLGEAGTAGYNSYMPPGNSGPTDWPGAFISMFMEHQQSFGVVAPSRRGPHGPPEAEFQNPGLVVQGPSTVDSVEVGPPYPAVWRGAVLEGGGGPGLQNHSDLYNRANVWVDATEGNPGLWVTDSIGTAAFIGVSGAPPQHLSAPPYVEGLVYYDTTLHKLRVGGASGWETITSV